MEVKTRLRSCSLPAMCALRGGGNLRSSRNSCRRLFMECWLALNIHCQVHARHNETAYQRNFKSYANRRQDRCVRVPKGCSLLTTFCAAFANKHALVGVGRAMIRWLQIRFRRMWNRKPFSLLFGSGAILIFTIFSQADLNLWSFVGAVRSDVFTAHK